MRSVVDQVVEAAMAVRRVFGPGYLEAVYERSLMVELAKRNIPAMEQFPIKIYYEGVNVGSFFADILVDGQLIVELKAVSALTPAHEAQLVNYLLATGIETGLLINFGSDRIEFRRKFRTYRPKGTYFQN